jgi:hypothetical protein
VRRCGEVEEVLVKDEIVENNEGYHKRETLKERKGGGDEVSRSRWINK